MLRALWLPCNLQTMDKCLRALEIKMQLRNHFFTDHS